ncbi:MAG: DUF2062 domain-containing protein [Holophaga sp.]|nr:DUF2062 domain-containing protein [Holophaga sp.]
MNVLAVIPVYNHAAAVRAVAQGVLDQGLPLLVVDDGSDDGSLERLAGLDLRRLRLERNGGKGQALLRAAALAGQWGYDAILTLDADGQHDPADARQLLAAAAGAWPAILVGARRMGPGDAPRASRFGRAFSNFWVRLECGQSLADTQSGYRLYPVPFLLARRFRSRGYGFEVEVLVRGAWAGLPLVAVPVSVYYPPGAARVSHFHLVKDNLRLAGLHTLLVLRALSPWPHRRVVPRPGGGLRRLLRGHASPLELAAAVGLGIFLGALPIIPFGLAVIVYVTGKLRLNPLAGAAASNLCVAPFVPFLCIQAGHLLRYGRLWSQFNRATLLGQVHQRAWEWLLGSLVLGPLLGLAGALVTYALACAYREAGTA